MISMYVPRCAFPANCFRPRSREIYFMHILGHEDADSSTLACSIASTITLSHLSVGTHSSSDIHFLASDTILASDHVRAGSAR